MSYPGGKEGAGVYQRIINLIPPHRTYIEPFAGGAAVLRHKRPSEVEVVLDVNPDVVRSLIPVGIERGSRFVALEGDAIAYLRQYPWQGGEVVYADPPYVWSARRTTRTFYAQDLTDEQHLELLEQLHRAAELGARVLLSGYRSALYDDRLAEWHRIDYQTMTRGGTLADESLWMSYGPPAVLHDHRYVGDSYRERERIKRRRRRWIDNFNRMAPLERSAIFHDLKSQFPEEGP